MASLGRVARVDRPSPGMLALTLRGATGSDVLVVGSHSSAWGAGLVSERPRGAPADAFAQGLRRRVLAADVLRVDEANGVLSVTLELAHLARLAPAEPSDEPLAAEAARTNPAWLLFERARGAMWLVSEEGVLLTTHPVAPCPARPTLTDDARVSRAELVSQGPAVVRAAATELLENGQRALTQALTKSIKRLTRKRDAILADAQRAEHAPQLRLDADLLLAHSTQQTRGPNGEGWVDVLDWSQHPPEPRRIALRYDERAADKASKLYHQARRLERGVRIAEERWALAEEHLERVQALATRCRVAVTLRELEGVAQAASALGVRELDDAAPGPAPGRKGPSRASARESARLPYRRFESSEGHPIWVGRSARENDALTLHHTKPHHLWLHVEGRAGSHVVVPLTRGAVVSSELLVDAAQLAVHFSGARDEHVVEVIYAERRHVVKPRGYPSGAVRVDRRKTVLLRQEPPRLAALLAREHRI